MFQSNWPKNHGYRYEDIGFGVGVGTAVTAAGDTTSKGTWVSIGTTGFDWNGFLLSLNAITAVRHRIDVGIGADKGLVVEDLFIDSGNAIVPYSLYVPVAIPSGSEIFLRNWSSTLSAIVHAGLSGYGQGFCAPPSVSSLRNITDMTNTLATNVATTNGTTPSAYAEINDSIPYDISRLIIMPSKNADTTRTAVSILVEVAIGAAASEIIVCSFILGQTTGTLLGSGFFDVPVALLAGTRLSFRITCSGATAGAEATVGLIAHGFVV